MAIEQKIRHVAADSLTWQNTCQSKPKPKCRTHSSVGWCADAHPLSTPLCEARRKRTTMKIVGSSNLQKLKNVVKRFLCARPRKNTTRLHTSNKKLEDHDIIVFTETEELGRSSMDRFKCIALSSASTTALISASCVDVVTVLPRKEAQPTGPP